VEKGESDMGKWTLALGALILAGCGGGGDAVQPASAVSNLTAFIGDSITRRWDLTQYDVQPTLNFGVDADTTVQMLARLHGVLAADPGVLVILGGVNDLQDFGPAGANIGSIKSMAAQAKAARIRVILCSVMPTTDFQFATLHFTLADVRAFNDQLIELAQQNGYLYADYYDEFLNPDGSVNNSLYLDGLHPSAAGYAVMWGVLEPLLVEELQ
jgi:lysophospholipase L1-like esterase